ncbi:MAG: peptide/nickel transport system ATP-binding protein ddpF [Thermoleophilaceae bacterium]|jgi:peptide/nickel transport system ATP-binding protein|nr:peptide/nickel transport system ATP-binding protein ddpF [Thermoleophilaceae bacterium]
MSANPDRADAPVVDIRGLRVDLPDAGFDVVDEVSLRVWPGEVLGLVGESGCGKTTVGLALLGHCRRGAEITAGEVLVDGRDIAGANDAELLALRGRVVAYIPQDPPTALNPALRIATQVREVLDAHLGDWTAEQRDERLREVLREVHLPSDDAFLRRYPHQLSGGQQQRVTIAMAFACRPKVIVCDEPTTGLDVITQERVLETVRELCRRHRVAAVYVSHDLAVVSSLADRVAVMYAGRVVESSSRDELFANPRHPYTRGLLRAVPDLDGARSPVGIPGHAPLPGARTEGCFFGPRCQLCSDECRREFPAVTVVGPGHEVRCHHAHQALPGEAARVPQPAQALGELVIEAQGLSASYGGNQVLHGVDLGVLAHECVALVGESGSGKTTLARCIAGLHPDYEGRLLLGGTELAPRARRRTTDERRRIQYIFQNPYASLHPRHTVGRSLAAPLRLFFGLKGSACARRVAELLERVSLSRAAAESFPEELSGGERQRVAVARALAAEPAVLVCDEITSALDVSVQAAVLELLADLQQQMGLSVLFITHNLALIRTIADRVAVMSEGRIVEVRPTQAVLEAPEAAYTRELLEHTPRLDPQPSAVAAVLGPDPVDPVRAEPQ